MKTETWLKIGSVLIYLFVPAFVIRLFFGFVEVLFLVSIPGEVSAWIATIFSALCTFIGVLSIADFDNYILKQKEKLNNKTK